MNKTQGLVNRIISFSSVDGPGNRLVIFLQGCNLDCISCHNPHTIGRCSFCGFCVLCCPEQALEIYFDDPAWMNYDETRCVNCDRCLEVCPESSNPRSRWMEVDELVQEIRKAGPFISGITVSGGEAMMQVDFVKELFTTLKEDPDFTHVTTFIDSNGVIPLTVWDSILPVTDGVMVDLKALDSEVHLELTGEDNQLVLQTIPHLYAQGKLYEVRLLIIPGYNSSEELIRKTSDFLSQVSPQVRIRLIPYRKHGVRPEAEELDTPDTGLMNQIKEIFAENDFRDIIVT